MSIPEKAVVELDGTFETLNLDSEGVCLVLSSEPHADTLNVNASAVVSGTGEIENANVNIRIKRMMLKLLEVLRRLYAPWSISMNQMRLIG